MKKLNNNQKGFGAVEGILILVIVGILGFTGWFVWHSNNESTPTQTPTSADTTPATNASTQTTTTKTATNDGYLVVKEWGIKIKVDDSEKVSYKISTDGDFLKDERKYEQVLSPSIKPAYLTDKGCSIGVAIYRSKTGGDDSQKVGNYYYDLDGNPADCTNDNDEQLAKAIRSDLYGKIEQL